MTWIKSTKKWAPIKNELKELLYRRFCTAKWFHVGRSSICFNGIISFVQSMLFFVGVVFFSFFFSIQIRQLFIVPSSWMRLLVISDRCAWTPTTSRLFPLAIDHIRFSIEYEIVSCFLPLLHTYAFFSLFWFNWPFYSVLACHLKQSDCVHSSHKNNS